MEIVFNIDYDTEELNLVVDNCCTAQVYLGDNDKLVFKNFEKLEDELLQRTLKNACKSMFELFRE